ncbi:MAG: hypothetical protein QMC93_01250 [Patescibacteria group bacterium]|nr:hypothetical protein [Patescibacteria group bacterium]
MKRFFIIFILIVFVGIGLAGYWYWQRNTYSKEILKLEILGQEEVQAGDEIEYSVRFKNNGKVRLEDVELGFEYPKTSIPQEGQTQRITQKIEDIYPGEERVVKFKAKVFGKENDILTVKAYLSFLPKNLKARYEVETSFVSRIKFVPLTFEFDLPLRIEGGEEIKFSLNYFSNIEELLKNLRVKINYPSGFSFLSSLPKGLDETEYFLPSLAQASGGRIEIKGKIEGQEGEEKVFKAQLGMLKDGEFWLLKEASQSIKIVEPSLHLSFLINNSQNYSASPGDFLHYEIFFRNIGRDPVQKKFLLAHLEGDFFDLASLKSEKGEIGKGDNTVLWDWKIVPELRFLDIDQEGKVEFWVKLKGNINYQPKNPKLKVKVNLAGLEKVFETKLNSQLEFSQKVYFEQEFFQNKGPLPPRVGESTEYVVLWQVKNSWNDLRNVKVKAVLPENVRPTGKIFPTDARFTFDSDSREVIWNIGEVKAWQGFKEEPLTLAFQIEFRPTVSQKGQSPLLIKEAEILAEDVFSSEILQEKAEGKDTTLPDDETVNEEQGIVE